MALDPNIILGASQPATVQMQSPLDTFMKGLSLRDLVNQSQSRQLAFQQQQQQYSDQQGLRSLFQSNPAPTAQQIYSAGGVQQGTAIIKGMTEAQQAAANLQKTKGDVANQENDFLGKVSGAVRQNNYSPESIQQALQLATNAGYGQHAQQIAAQLQANPASAKQVFDGLYQSAMSAKDQAMAQAAAITANAKQQGVTEQGRHNVTTEQQAAQNALEVARNNAFNNRAKGVELQQANVRNNISAQDANINAQRAAIEKQRFGLDQGMVGVAPPNATGDAALQGMDPRSAALVKAIANYQMPAPNRMTGPGAQILAKVAQYDPTYQASQYGAVKAIQKDYTSGATAKSINAINTAIGHLGELQEAANGLHNSGWAFANKIGNYLKGETDDPAIKQYGQTANAVASELSKAYGGQSEGDVQRWQANASPDMGPAQQQKAVKTAVGLLAKKIGSIQDQWSKTPLGKRGAFPILSPDAKATLTKLGYDPNTLQPIAAGGGATVKMQAPDGTVSSVPATLEQHYTQLGAKVVQ